MDNMLTVKQVAQRLQVAAITVRRLVWSGELPHTRVGRAIRIKESDLQAYIDRLGKVSALACAAEGYTPAAAYSRHI